jgi:hypothetical protein
MYNNGNSSKNVTGASVVDGTLENADYADNAISGDKVDGGIISNFQSTGIDDRLATGKCIYTKNTNVGVGTSNPVYNLVVSNGGAEGLEIGTGYLGNKNLFQNYNRSTGAYVEAVNVASQYIFQTNGVEKVRFPAAGGITFNGDTAAANALDDYEEGTWTPVLYGATTAGTTSGGVISGTYVKIGRSVTISFHLWGVTPSGAAGQLSISGMPFTVGSGRASCIPQLNGVTYSTAGQFSFSSDEGSAVITGVESFPGTWANVLNITNVALYISGSITYQAT